MHPTTVLEQLFFTTVRIEATFSGRKSVGTGFFYGVPTGPGQQALFIVTNKHVLVGADLVRFFCIGGSDGEQLLPDLGRVIGFELDHQENVVFAHPDPEVDIAIVSATATLGPLQAEGVRIFFRIVDPSMAVTSALSATFDALEQVTFVGYPNGLYDRSNGLPIARRGVTASLLSLDYGGVPTFLVDAAVFPGSSGSPVFIAQSGSYALRDGSVRLGSRCHWLGVIAAVHTQQLGVVEAAGSHVQQPIGLGIVYKASCVDELVDLVFASNGLSRYVTSSSALVSTPTEEPDALSGT